MNLNKHQSFYLSGTTASVKANILIVLLLAAILSGCTSTHRSGLMPVVIADNMTLQLLAPAISQAGFVETQLIKASYGQQEHKLLVQIESVAQQITLVALTTTGTRLASVSLTSDGIQAEALSILPAQFDVAQLLAAYQLSTRAIQALQANIVGGVLEFRSSNNKRMLLQQGKPVIEISFDINEQQQPTIFYQHYLWDYKIHITTLSKQPL